MDVGLIGLGAMGRGMAGSLRRAGHRVHVCDIRAESVRDFAAEGGVGIVLDTARAAKFPLPLASTAHQMFLQTSAAGHGREDDAAVINIFPGIELPAKR